jgi:hypothetical protein
LKEKGLHQRLRPRRGKIPGDGPDEDPPSQWRGVLSTIWDKISDDFLVILFATGAGLVRAMGVTIESGQTGLLFSFGRARRTLAPGFHPLIPFLQRVRRLPTRSRTLDMPAQRVVTLEGLVYHVDANLVYRVTDVRKALVEVDHLEKGMYQMLGMGIQEVLRQATRDELRETADLDKRLADNLARRLAAWGVEVERAGFPSITPSPRTLRITQLASLTDERQHITDIFAKGGLASGPRLGLVGTRHMPRSRTRHLRRQETEHRRLRRIRTGLLRRGWSAPEQKRAGLGLILRHRLAQRA